jgi:hypothetical protein
MSAVTLNYPDVSRVQRVPAIGRILILNSIALIGIAILLTVSSANADLSNPASSSNTSHRRRSTCPLYNTLAFLWARQRTIYRARSGTNSSIAIGRHVYQ